MKFMKYMGSKSKISKHIVPIIQSRINEFCISTYIEPFVGGGNIIDKIVANKKIGCDKQHYLIALYQNMEKIKTLPDFVDKQHYDDVRQSFNKKDGKYADWYVGAIGFLASYNGRFFDGGYAGLVNTKIGTTRNYYAEAKNNLEKQIPYLQNIEWRSGDYKDTCVGAKNCLIYCDPPYYNTKKYGVSHNFQYDEFWAWVRKMSNENIVLISESTAPNDFECVWEYPIKRTIDNAKSVQSIERLFELK